MPNLTSEHHYIVVPTTDWKKRAIERDTPERTRARATGLKEVFKHPKGLGWCGYILEYAFHALYPHMKAVSSKYGKDKKDFFSPRTGLTYDTKLRPHEDDAFYDSANHFISDYQMRTTGADIFVAGYFFTKSPHIRICGWLYKEQVKKRGELFKKGSKKWVKVDVWVTPFAEYNSMHVMPDKVSGYVNRG